MEEDKNKNNIEENGEVRDLSEEIRKGGKTIEEDDGTWEKPDF